MKGKNFLILALIMLVVLMFNAGVVTPIDSPVLKMTLLRYDPAPAKPGDYITAYVQIENIGGAQAKNVRVTFKDNYPFSMDDLNSRSVTAGKIEIGQIYITTFKIRVDSNAVQGANDLKFSLVDDYTVPSSSETERIFSVNVEQRESNIVVESVTTDPAQITPGDSGEVTITLKNNAETKVTDLKTKLSVVVSTGTTVADIPFAVKDSVTEKLFDSLSPGEEKKVVYDIVTYPTITPGIYKLPLIITYFDNSGQNVTLTNFLTITVNPKVDVYMAIDSSKLTSESMTGAVTIRVVNKGLGGIKLADLKLETSPDYDILSSSSESYIGNIDSDDYKTADFTIAANKGEITLPLTLTFKDALNQEHEIKSNIALQIFSQNALSPKKASYTWVFVLLIIIVGVAVYYFRRKKK